eukprot:4113991-Amphidinium_carterae.1
MTESLENLLQVGSSADLEKSVLVWRQSFEQVKLLAAGVTKSANNLNGHVQNKRRKLSREQTQKKKEEENKELQAFQAKAREAARAVKEQEGTLPAIFQISIEKLEGEGVAKPFVEIDFSSSSKLLLVEPAAVRKCPKIEEWSQNSRMLVTFGFFGGKYKKQEAYLQGSQQDSRTQLPLYAKEGREECTELANSFWQLVPSNMQAPEQHDFKKLTQQTWLYGYSPSLATAAMTPNGFPMLKVLVHGEVKWLVFELASLLAALRTQKQKESFATEEALGAQICVRTSYTQQKMKPEDGKTKPEPPPKMKLEPNITF